MNTYRTSFFSACPSNGVRIKYRLRIQTHEVILVEDILARVGGMQAGYHEAIADELFKRFGGLQKLSAKHHGVRIVTTR